MCMRGTFTDGIAKEGDDWPMLGMKRYKKYQHLMQIDTNEKIEWRQTALRAGDLFLSAVGELRWESADFWTGGTIAWFKRHTISRTISDTLWKRRALASARRVPPLPALISFRLLFMRVWTVANRSAERRVERGEIKFHYFSLYSN